MEIELLAQPDIGEPIHARSDRVRATLDGLLMIVRDAKYPPGGPTKSEQIILDGVPEEDRAIARLEMTRFLNSTPDAGRPSDAARSIVRAYQASPSRFRARFHETRGTADPDAPAYPSQDDPDAGLTEELAEVSAYVLVFGERPRCSNCDHVGSFKAILRNAQGNPCGALFACREDACRHAIEQTIIQQTGPVTYRPMTSADAFKTLNDAQHEADHAEGTARHAIHFPRLYILNVSYFSPDAVYVTYRTAARIHMGMAPFASGFATRDFIDDPKTSCGREKATMTRKTGTMGDMGRDCAAGSPVDFCRRCWSVEFIMSARRQAFIAASIHGLPQSRDTRPGTRGYNLSAEVMLPDRDFPPRADSLGVSNPCFICQKQINAPRFFLVLDEGLGMIVDPKTPEPNGGGHAIGMNCRKNFNLEAYTVTLKGNRSIDGQRLCITCGVTPVSDRPDRATSTFASVSERNAFQRCEACQEKEDAARGRVR